MSVRPSLVITAALTTVALASCSSAPRPADAPARSTSPAASTPARAAVPSSAGPSSAGPSSAGPLSTAASPARTRTAAHMPAAHPSSTASTLHPVSAHPTRPPQPTSATRVPVPPGTQLPLDYPTATARQVITVVANARSDTRATVQAWRRVAGGWRRVGPAVAGFVGSSGMTPTPNEQTSAAPMGSWTLTQAFGHDPDPGTRLPYRQTTPADWWISQAGPLYNTLQHCSSGCAFTQGDPNEHLYYETPYYDYAVVIDYNRSPVRQGAGSAFFLHVSVGAPTAGCVSVDSSQLVRLMRWLRPADHPRILIGTS